MILKGVDTWIDLHEIEGYEAKGEKRQVEEYYERVLHLAN
jgi:hypothetical protein